MFWPGKAVHELDASDHVPGACAVDELGARPHDLTGSTTSTGPRDERRSRAAAEQAHVERKERKAFTCSSLRGEVLGVPLERHHYRTVVEQLVADLGRSSAISYRPPDWGCTK